MRLQSPVPNNGQSNDNVRVHAEPSEEIVEQIFGMPSDRKRSRPSSSSLDFKPDSSDKTKTTPIRKRKSSKDKRGHHHQQQQQQNQQQQQVTGRRGIATRARGSSGIPPHKFSLSDLEGMTEEQLLQALYEDPELAAAAAAAAEKSKQQPRTSSAPAGSTASGAPSNKYYRDPKTGIVKDTTMYPEHLREKMEGGVPVLQWLIVVLLVGAGVFQLHKTLRIGPSSSPPSKKSKSAALHHGGIKKTSDKGGRHKHAKNKTKAKAHNIATSTNTSTAKPSRARAPVETNAQEPIKKTMSAPKKTKNGVKTVPVQEGELVAASHGTSSTADEKQTSISAPPASAPSMQLQEETKSVSKPTTPKKKDKKQKKVAPATSSDNETTEAPPAAKASSPTRADTNEPAAVIGAEVVQQQNDDGDVNDSVGVVETPPLHTNNFPEKGEASDDGGWETVSKVKVRSKKGGAKQLVKKEEVRENKKVDEKEKTKAEAVTKTEGNSESVTVAENNSAGEPGTNKTESNGVTNKQPDPGPADVGANGSVNGGVADKSANDDAAKGAIAAKENAGATENGKKETTTVSTVEKPAPTSTTNTGAANSTKSSSKSKKNKKKKGKADTVDKGDAIVSIEKEPVSKPASDDEALAKQLQLEEENLAQAVRQSEQEDVWEEVSTKKKNKRNKA